MKYKIKAILNEGTIYERTDSAYEAEEIYGKYIRSGYTEVILYCEEVEVEHYKKIPTKFDEITKSPAKLAEFIHMVTQICASCGASEKVKITGCELRQIYIPDGFILPCMDKQGIEQWLLSPELVTFEGGHEK